MDQTKAVPVETSTPLNAWLLTSALSFKCVGHSVQPRSAKDILASLYAGLYLCALDMGL